MFLAEGFCESTKDIWTFVGTIVTIFKIVIPAILVVIGIVAFGKAVISDDDKATKSAVMNLVKKVILAVFIFFIPQLISWIFSAVWPEKNRTSTNDFPNCIDYIAGTK